MALLAGELANDTSLSDAAREDIALLRQQIGVCKQIITGLSRRAGAKRGQCRIGAGRPLAGHLRQHWHAARPQAGSRLIIASDGSAPAIAADPRLEQAILNLLNNAANATPRPLEIRLSWCSENLCIDIRDHGPAFLLISWPRAARAVSRTRTRQRCGPDPDPTAIEQLGGRLTLFNPDDGGALPASSCPERNHESSDADHRRRPQFQRHPGPHPGTSRPSRLWRPRSAGGDCQGT
jgi:two-component system sensor histidine kinase RegB